MSPSDDAARAAVSSWIQQRHEELDRSSYYQLLGVKRGATPAEVRTGYYAMVARFHPDMYGEFLDEPTRLKLVAIYSRIVEGYKVLADPKRREQYDRLLATGGAAHLRYTVTDERAPKDPEAEIVHPNAKRFFRLAREAERNNDLRAAAMNLKLALSVEPSSSALKAELARVEGDKGHG